MVLAHGLEPEGLNTQRTPADFRVPQEKPRREGLTFDLDPGGRIDKEQEQVLLPAVEPGCAIEAFRRRLEAVGAPVHQVSCVIRVRFGASGVRQVRVSSRALSFEIISQRKPGSWNRISVSTSSPNTHL